MRLMRLKMRKRSVLKISQSTLSMITKWYRREPKKTSIDLSFWTSKINHISATNYYWSGEPKFHKASQLFQTELVHPLWGISGWSTEITQEGFWNGTEGFQFLGPLKLALIIRGIWGNAWKEIFFRKFWSRTPVGGFTQTIWEFIPSPDTFFTFFESPHYLFWTSGSHRGQGFFFTRRDF